MSRRLSPSQGPRVHTIHSSGRSRAFSRLNPIFGSVTLCKANETMNRGLPPESVCPFPGRMPPESRITRMRNSLNRSDSGLDFSCDLEIPVDTVVYIAAHEAFTASYSLVRYCKRNRDSYVIGVELTENPQPGSIESSESQNYYEFFRSALPRSLAPSTVSSAIWRDCTTRTTRKPATPNASCC